MPALADKLFSYLHPSKVYQTIGVCQIIIAIKESCQQDRETWLLATVREPEDMLSPPQLPFIREALAPSPPVLAEGMLSPETKKQLHLQEGCSCSTLTCGSKSRSIASPPLRRWAFGHLVGRDQRTVGGLPTFYAQTFRGQSYSARRHQKKTDTIVRV